jgi:hypothetical protein
MAHGAKAGGPFDRSRPREAGSHVAVKSSRASVNADRAFQDRLRQPVDRPVDSTNLGNPPEEAT